jgi:hypothetical protein
MDCISRAALVDSLPLRRMLILRGRAWSSLGQGAHQGVASRCNTHIATHQGAPGGRYLEMGMVGTGPRGAHYSPSLAFLLALDWPLRA